ncbi:MAG TPA: creatininase family protein [Paracoccaceae bacterium]|nr:creatininase family protein [Paracoccaceae bacterium]
MPRRFWHEFRATEFPPADPARAIAVLPTAAVEQHGPHLPLGTDMLIMEGMLATACRMMPEDLDIRILPVQAIGKSNEHLWAAGTLTLTAEGALAAWTEIGLSVARAGFRKLVIVNSHGGNLDLVGILARELRVRAGLYAVKCQWGAFGHPEGLYAPDELRFGIHGGDVETSLMLHFRPDLVEMGAARHFRSSAEDGGILPTGPLAFGWIASDLNPAGVVGNAAAASADKGRLTAEHQARGFLALLAQVRDFDLGRLAT